MSALGQKQTCALHRPTSALTPKADSCSAAAYVRFGPILLQKSPSEHCGIEICNNRIGAEAFLNRCCALVGVLESLLRAWMLKILLQQNRPKADSCSAAKKIVIRSPRRQRSTSQVAR